MTHDHVDGGTAASSPCPHGQVITHESIEQAGQLVKQLGEAWNVLADARKRKADRFEVARAEENVLALLPGAMQAISPIGVAAEGLSLLLGNIMRAAVSRGYQPSTGEHVVDWIKRTLPQDYTEQQATDRDTARLYDAAAQCLQALLACFVCNDAARQGIPQAVAVLGAAAKFVAAGTATAQEFRL